MLLNKIAYDVIQVVGVQYWNLGGGEMSIKGLNRTIFECGKDEIIDMLSTQAVLSYYLGGTIKVCWNVLIYTILCRKNYLKVGWGFENISLSFYLSLY